MTVRTDKNRNYIIAVVSILLVLVMIFDMVLVFRMTSRQTRDMCRCVRNTTVACGATTTRSQ